MTIPAIDQFTFNTTAVELTRRIKTFLEWDEASASAEWVFSQLHTVAEYTGTASTRAVRATLASGKPQAGGGKWYCEMIVELPTNVGRVGVTTTAAFSPTAHIGAASGSCAIVQDSLGGVVNNGSTTFLVYAPVFQTGDVIRLGLDLDAMKLVVAINDRYIGRLNVTLSAAGTPTWVPAFSDSASSGSTRSVELFGKLKQFRYPVFPGFEPWENESEEHYVFSSNGALVPSAVPPSVPWFSFPGEYYDARLIGGAKYAERLGSALWAMQGNRVDFGSLEIANQDGALDHFLDLDWRDARCRVLYGQFHPDAIDSSYMLTLSDALVADLVRMPNRNLAVTLRSPAAQLDNIANRRTVPDDGTIPDGVAGRPYPLALGEVALGPGVVFDQPNLLYNVMSSPHAAMAIAGTSSLSTLYSVGIPVSSFERSHNRYVHGFRRTVNPAGKHGVARACGLVLLGDALVNQSSNGDFEAGGAAFTGWTETSSPTANDVVRPTAAHAGTVNAARFVCNGAGVAAVRLRHTATAGTLAAGEYYVEIEVLQATSGTIRVTVGNATLQVPVTAGGLNRIQWLARSTTGSGNFDIEVHNTSAAADFTVSRARLWEAQGTHTIEAYVRALVEQEADPRWTFPISVGASVGDLDTEYSSHRVGLFSDAAMSYSAALTALADSWWGAWRIDGDGAVQLFRPVLPTTGDPVAFEIFPDMLLQPAKIDRDHAPGLSNVVQGGRNYAVHSSGDIAGSVYATDSDLAEQLQSEYWYRGVSRESLGDRMSHVYTNDPLSSLWQSVAACEEEADRAMSIYSELIGSSQPAHVEVIIPIQLLREPVPWHLARVFRLTLTDPAYNDRPMLCVGIGINTRDGRATINLWG